MNHDQCCPVQIHNIIDTTYVVSIVIFYKNLVTAREYIYGISRMVEVIPYQFESEPSPDGDSRVDVLTGVLAALLPP